VVVPMAYEEVTVIPELDDPGCSRHWPRADELVLVHRKASFGPPPKRRSVRTLSATLTPLQAQWSCTRQ